MSRRLSAACALTMALTAVTATDAAARPGPGTAGRDDSYLVLANRAVRVPAGVGVLANDRLDRGWGAVASTTPAGHGTATVAADGSFAYRPAPGFHGVDSFTYTATDAVRVYPTKVSPLATIGGVTITGAGFGSAVTPVPGVPGEFYGLTDRGPNVDGPAGSKVEPLPEFTPAIGRFRMVNDFFGTRAILLATIPLRAADDAPFNGQANSTADTGETIVDLAGHALAASPYGYDSEGLVARPDGSFWVSDEYGPFITHFDRTGRQLSRLSPYDATLPAELAKRVPNKGMEGLTITPDGRTLVGIMQNSLQPDDVTGKTGSYPLVRIVTVDLASDVQHEYAYLLDDPGANNTGVSEITAVSATQFLVDERDGNVEPQAYKKLWRIDLDGATDIGPAASGYSATGGLLIAGRTLESAVGKSATTTAQTILAAAGITPVSKTLDLDLGTLVSTLSPDGHFFGHDKIEGVATTDAGRTLLISNDSDFGINGLTDATVPYQLQAKILPNGVQDDGEYLAVDTTRLANGIAPTYTRTVHVYVL